MPLSSSPRRPSKSRRTGAGLVIALVSALALGAAPAAALTAAPAGSLSQRSVTEPSAVHPAALNPALPAAATAAAARKFANCTALNRVYPHGVGKTGARDKVRGKSKPVTNFTRNNAVYAANTKSDADKDGIACEKR